MRKLIEQVFAVAMLFYITDALAQFLAGNDDPLVPAQGSLVAIGIQIALYSLTFYFIATRWQPFLRGALKTRWIMALLVLAVASSAWSQDPAQTLRRSVLLIATTAFAIYFATRFDISEQSRLLAWALGITVCLSFLLGLFFPQIGIGGSLSDGEWHGIFAQKNGLAKAMVLSCLVFLFARPGFNRVVRWTGFCGSLGLLILSRSISGLLILAFLLGTFPLLKLLRTRITFAVPVGLAIFSMLLVAVRLVTPSLQELLEMANRSSTLTGRTDIWSAVLVSISRHPLLGYGFHGFWLGMKGEAANVILSLRWTPMYAHNGFLDLWLELGILGVVTFVAGYLHLWKRALKVLRAGDDPTAIWLCLYLLFTVFYNLSEGWLVRENTIFWALYTSTAVNLFLCESPVVARAEEVMNYEIKPDLSYLS